MLLKAKSNWDEPTLMHLPDPTFPPLLTGHGVKAPDTAFGRACDAAANGKAGASDVFWGRNTAQMDWAIVLEPDVPAPRAQQMLMVAETAFSDAVGAIAPPEVGVQFRWPGGILINGAQAGDARIAMGPDGADGFPAWMVIGLMVHIRRKTTVSEPGNEPGETDMTEEGCGELDRTQLVEALSRHFLNHVHGWNEEGFRPVHEAWMRLAENVGGTINIMWQDTEVEGQFLSIDDEGNLILKTGDETTALPLAAFVRRPGVAS